MVNYTKGCTEYGCNSSTSLGEGYANGYWGGDAMCKYLNDNDVRAWRVNKKGVLSNTYISNETDMGVRPVMIVSKSQI